MNQFSRKKGRQKSENTSNDSTLYLQQSLIDKEAAIAKQAEDLKRKDKYISAFKKLSFTTNSNIIHAFLPPYDRIENIRDQTVLQTLSNSNKSLESKCETLNAKVRTLENELRNKECIILKHELVIRQYSKIIEEDKVLVEDFRNDKHNQKIVRLQLERKCMEALKWARRLGKIIEKHEIPLSKTDTNLLHKIQQQLIGKVSVLKTCSLEVDKEDITSSDDVEDELPESKTLKNQETQTDELVPNSLICKDYRKIATYTDGLGVLSPSLTDESVGLSPGLSVSGLSPVSLDDSCTHFKDSFQTYGPLHKETMPSNEESMNEICGLTKENCLHNADYSPASPTTSLFDPELINNKSPISDADLDEGILNENPDDSSEKLNMPVFDELNSSTDNVESSVVVNDGVSTADVSDGNNEVVQDNALPRSNDLLSQEIIHQDNKYVEILKYRDHFEVVIHSEDPEQLDGENKSFSEETSCIRSEISDKLECNESKLSGASEKLDEVIPDRVGEEPAKSNPVSEKLENASPISDKFNTVPPVTKKLSTSSPMINGIITVNDEIGQVATVFEAINVNEKLNKESDIILAQIADESNVSSDLANDTSSLQNNSNYQFCSDDHSYAARRQPCDGESDSLLFIEQISKTEIVEADKSKEETKTCKNSIITDKGQLLSIPRSLSEHKVDDIDEGTSESVNSETTQFECSRQDSSNSSCVSSDSMISVSEDNDVSTRKHHSDLENQIEFQFISETLEIEKTPQSKSKCTENNISCLESNKDASSPPISSSPQNNHKRVERQAAPQKSIFDNLEPDCDRDNNLPVNLHSPNKSLDFEDESSDLEQRFTHSESNRNCDTKQFKNPESSKQVLVPDNTSTNENSKANRKIEVVEDKVLDKIMRRMQMKSILKGHVISPIPPSPQSSEQGPSIQMELSMLSSDEEKKNSAATDQLPFVGNPTKSIQKDGNLSTPKKEVFRRLRGVSHLTKDKNLVPVPKCVAGDLVHNLGSNFTQEFNFKKPKSVGLSLNELSAGIPIHSEKESKRFEDAKKGSPGCFKPNHSISGNSSSVEMSFRSNEKSHFPKHCGSIEVKNFGKQQEIVSTLSLNRLQGADEKEISIDGSFKSSHQSSTCKVGLESKISKLFNNPSEPSCLENLNHSLVDRKTANEVNCTDITIAEDVKPTPEHSEGDNSSILSDFGLIECDFEKLLAEIRGEFHVPDCIDKLSDSDSSSDTLEMDPAQVNDLKEMFVSDVSLKESTQVKIDSTDQSERRIEHSVISEVHPISSQCCKMCEDRVEEMCESHNSMEWTTVLDQHSNNSRDEVPNPSENSSLLEDNPIENLESETSCMSNKTCTNGNRITSEIFDSTQSSDESVQILNPPIPFHGFEHRESNSNIESLPVSNNNLPESDESHLIGSLPNEPMKESESSDEGEQTSNQCIPIDDFQQCTSNSFERSIEKRPVSNNLSDESGFKGCVSNVQVNRIDSVQSSDEVAHSSCKFVAVNSFEHCTSNSTEKHTETPTVSKDLSDSDESDFEGWGCTSYSSEKTIETPPVSEDLPDTDDSDFKGWVCTLNSPEKSVENPPVSQNLLDSGGSDFKGWVSNEQVKKTEAIQSNDEAAQSSNQPSEKAQNTIKHRRVNAIENIQPPVRRSARVLDKNGNNYRLSHPSRCHAVKKRNNSKQKTSENPIAADKKHSPKCRVSNQVENDVSRMKETPQYPNTRSGSLPNTLYCKLTRRRSLLMNSCYENANEIKVNNSKSDISVASGISEDTSQLQRSLNLREVNCLSTEKVECENANGFRNVLKSKNENLSGRRTRRSHPSYNCNRKSRRMKIDEIKTSSDHNDGRKPVILDHGNLSFGELNVSNDGNKNHESPSVSSQCKSENLSSCLITGKTPENSSYDESERPSLFDEDLKDCYLSNPLNSKYNNDLSDDANQSKNSEEFSPLTDRMIEDNRVDFVDHDLDYSDDVLLIDCPESSKDENQVNVSNNAEIPSRNDDEMENGVISMQSNCYDLDNSTTVCRNEDQRHIPVIGIEQRKSLRRSLRTSTIIASQNSDLRHNLKINLVPNVIDESATAQVPNIKENRPSHKSATDLNSNLKIDPVLNVTNESATAQKLNIEKVPTLNFYSEVSETANVLSEQSDKRKLSENCDSPDIEPKRRKIKEDPSSETISLDPHDGKNVDVSNCSKTEEIRMVQCDNVITMAYHYHRTYLYKGREIDNSIFDESYPEEGFEHHNQLAEELFIRVAKSSLEEDESVKEEKNSNNSGEYWTTELLEACLEKLKDIPNKVISDVIIDTLYNDEDDPDIDAAAPLSDLQKKVITIAFKLCSSRPEFFNSLLMSFKKFLFLDAAHEMVNKYCKYVRFITVLCRALDKLQEMRWFVYDLLYLKKMSGLPMAFTALIMWPSLLPMASPIETVCPLAFCISHVLLNSDIKIPQKRLLYKTNRIDHLLKHYYGYTDTSPDVVFNHIMKKIHIEGALEAVALLCKRIGPKWTLTFVVERSLLPILNEWKMKKNSSEAVVHAIRVLSYVLRPFLQGTNNAKLNDVLRNIGTFLSDPEADDRIQAVAAESLCRLSKGNMPLCTELLINWKPRSGMVPVQLIKQMRAFIARRKPVRWLEVMARNNLIKP